MRHVPFWVISGGGSWLAQTSGVYTSLAVPSEQVNVRSIRPNGATAGSLLAWVSRMAPPTQNGDPPRADPSRTTPVAIGSDPGSAATCTSARISTSSPLASGLGLALGA